MTKQTHNSPKVQPLRVSQGVFAEFIMVKLRGGYGDNTQTLRALVNHWHETPAMNRFVVRDDGPLEEGSQIRVHSVAKEEANGAAADMVGQGLTSPRNTDIIASLIKTYEENETVDPPRVETAVAL